MTKIITLDSLNELEQERVLKEIKEIFYEASSVKSFRDEDHKNLFFEKWCGDYFTNFPDTFYLLIDTESNKLLGYLSGVTFSESALSKLRVPGQLLFQDQFSLYPAHLHINFHTEARGRGLGSSLVDYFCSVLRASHSKGVHLVTSPEARNVNFYIKLGFDYKLIRNNLDSDLLFLAKKLD